jgi:hypothetical protein
MKYTNHTLHGLVYYHKADSPTDLRRIILMDVSSGTNTHTTCNLTDGRTAGGAWFNLEKAQDWIDNGIWILVKQESEIINQYEIY